MKFPASQIFWIMVLTLITLVSSLTTRQTEIIQHTASDTEKEGFWAHKETWKSRWVKYWRAKTIYVPVWKKVWTPLIQNEWVPLPNSPPGWSKSENEHKISEIEY
ncbi:uncharacterized protein LOC106093960 [Stomoxys calcitrans]|uniref:uncharacterized protein LOC106093960 n=1 Tax=Stomoxys calcitrans TaxID=35570 RepID=UPI0027E34E74|nr:uncharacterized protein LOC106093960 [Stomoxys calcitrans]